MSAVVDCPACATHNRLPVAAAGAPHCARCGADLPWLTAAGDADFDAAVATPLLVLVDLWAPWCGPCRTVAPAVERAAQVLAGRLKVVKVNVDEAPGVAARFGVRGIPTLLLLRDGQVADRQTGALPDQALLAWVQGQAAAAARPPV
ncbi:MAG TPA: thioredoxin [Candidatus Dormibacteraeota bacterium]|nr:thioredoxin [Candidatus Dormibacteraeota bacterium]